MSRVFVVTRARIGSLRLRVPGGDARTGKTLAMAVASTLALRAGELAGAETLRARITTPGPLSRDLLVHSIVGAILNPRVETKGRH